MNLHYLQRIRLALLLSFACPAFFAPSPASSQTPLALSGYNADVITDANPATRFAQPLDIGTAAFFQAGAIDDNGAAHANGLPTGDFTSAFTNSVTGGHTDFTIQPADVENALLMRYSPTDPAGNTGTLTLNTPGKYSSLAILAAGYNASPTDLGSVILNFTDGTHSQPLNYDAFDWGYGTSHQAITGMGRNYDVGSDGKAFNYNEPVPFSLFETDLNLTALGYADDPLESLSFTGGIYSDQPGVANHGPSTSIMAVSGNSLGGGVVPEPSPILPVLIGFGLLGLVGVHKRRVLD